jgi:hypothetical protein
LSVVFTWRRAENLGLAVLALGLSLLTMIPVAAHLYFVEDIFTKENLPFFSACLAGLAVIFSALILGMVQETFVPSGEGKINTSKLLTAVSYLSIVYLGTYLGLAFTAEYLEGDIFVVSDVANEIREMTGELRFLIFQFVALCTTYVSSIFATLYARHIAQTE